MQTQTQRKFLLAEYDAAFCRLVNAPPEVDAALKESLFFNDSKIEMQNQRSRFQFENPRVDLYNTQSHSFLTGLLPRVSMILRNKHLDYELSFNKLVSDAPIQDLNLEDIVPFPDKPSIKPWAHQVEMVDKLRRVKRGIVQSPTGSGKTTAIAMFCKLFPFSDIIVSAPDIAVMKNNAETIERIVGEPVGRVGGGKRDYKRITSAVTKTLAIDIREDPTKFTSVQVHIVDECHTCGHNDTSYRICEGLNHVDYRVGFSATPWREGGDTKAMEGCIGPVVFQQSEEELQKQGILEYFKYLIIQVPDDPTVRYPKWNSKMQAYDTPNAKPERLEVYRTMIVANKQRNKMIIDIIKEYHRAGHPFGPCLVVTDLIDHANILYNALSAVLTPEEELAFVSGQTSKKKRLEVIERVRERTLPFTISNRVFNVGVDFPAAGFLINAAGGNAKSTLIQKLGRIIRSSDGKKGALFVDFEDMERFYLHQNYVNRLKTIRERYPSNEIRKASLKEVINEFNAVSN